MKLLICDDKKINTFQLPKNTENFFMINFEFNMENLVFNEILTLKYNNEKWIIVSDDRLSIKNNGTICSEVVLEENMIFELKFADMSDFFKVYITPDFSNFVSYSINENDKIDIGSSRDCQIFSQSLINHAVILKKDGYDYIIEKIDSKKSGIYLNSHVFDKARLSIGDNVFIYGIKIIYMKTFLLIDRNFENLQITNLRPIIDENKNIETIITPVNDLEKNVKLYNDNELFVHTPRLKNEIEEIEIVFEEPPEKENGQKIPAIFTLGSSALMCMTSSVSLISSFTSFKNGNTDLLSFLIEIIVFGLMFVASFFLPLLSSKWEERTEKKREKLRQEKYKKYIEEKEQLIKKVIVNQENILRTNNISLEKIRENILNNNTELWSREIFDTDFLSLMIGIGNIPAKINVTAPEERFSLYDDNLKQLVLEVANKKNTLNDVPFTFSITDNIIMPIVINSETSDDYIKSIMLQLIYFYSSNDLKIVTITNEYNKNKWDFMKYLPHSWNKNYNKRFFATNEEEVAQLSIYLEQEFENRVKELKDDKENQTKPFSNFQEYFLIVTDDYKLARELSVINKILDLNKNIGFSLLIFEKTIKNLPSRFNTLIQIVDDKGFIIEKNKANNNQFSFTPTLIKNLEIEKYAKIISNVPVNIKSAKYDIPSSLTFLDMFYAGRVEQLNILSRWQSNNPTISLKTTIGMKDNNKLIELDLHEKYHGPHGLIAGSTGSGKSEFIITFILSMAINYHPYEVQFVLIDYKGGGLAGAFENRESGIRIPHLVGTITNLDKSEMNRTLVSIKSELQRRQRVFNETRERLDESTIDIYKYQRLYREGKVSEPMSHLFIISDEFAELKAQQPDFMDELVSAARIGRSLGVHLILATQKPSGVVDEQIWSNTRFRVCLKVQTADDSNEVLKNSDASYIKEAGRFYLQVGNNEIYELGQSGWAGAKYVPSDNVQKKLDDNISILSDNGDIIKSLNEEVKKETNQDLGEQLINIVKYLYNLGIRENIKFTKLWLDNIPEILVYDSVIKKYNYKSKPYYINPVIGEYDDPSNQKQGLVDLPLIDTGNIFITGASGSGKSTLLSTIVYSTIINHNADEVNIYIIDLGTEKLKCFQNAPQIGDVLTSADRDKIKFLFYMLKDEKDKRFAHYSNNGGDFEKDIAKGYCPFPNIIVAINQFDVFKESFEEIYDNDFVPFTRNCAKVGIFFIVTSTTTTSLGYMAENNFPKKIMLNMVDTTDYQMFFDNSPIPKKNAGRGIISLDEAYEFQVSLIFEEALYDKKLNYVINQLKKHLMKKAKKVPVIPEEVTFDLLKERIKTLSSVPLGINMLTAQISTFDFNNLLNVSSANNLTAAKNFFPKLIEIISNIQNTKIIIINSLKNLSLEFSEDIKYYDSNFKTIMGALNNNVNKYLTENSPNNYFIIFLGYTQLQMRLLKEQEDDDEIITIDDLIYNSKASSNFKYLIFENDTLLEKIGDGKLDSLFKRNNGIWLGKEFDSQSIFDINNIYGDNVNLGSSNITIIKNGNTEHIKYM